MPGVEVVENEAFDDCKALTDVECGELERIGRNAFEFCESLTSINLQYHPPRSLRDGHSLTVLYSPDEGCKNLKQVDLVEGGSVHEIIAALLLEEWKIVMKDKIDSINQILPNAPAGSYDNNHGDVGGKAEAVRMWISSVLHKIIRYKAQHRSILNEAATTLQLASPNDVVLENVLPFIELPSFTFQGED
eukprot:scaffold1897_cov74-Skeletonema_dohrnii-CCMP3373.AAC.4